MKKRTWYIIGGVIISMVAITIFTSEESSESAEILISPQRGDFEVTVTTTGELEAKNATDIMGPGNARRARIWNMTIESLIPEGTVVDSGEYVAQIDKSELDSRIQDRELSLQTTESQFTQVKLDCTLTLSQARDDLVNLAYAMEERKLAVEQSKYESPSIQRQTEIDYEKAVRQYEQAKKNYKTRVQQAEAKMREAAAEYSKDQNRLNELLDLEKQFTIYAPKKGMVVYFKEWDGRKRTEGSQIGAWDPVVARLPDLSVMVSKTYVNEVDIQKVKSGQHVRIGLDADPEKKLTGTVTDVANIGEQRPNSDAKVFEVTIEVNEMDTLLRPSMTTANKIVVSSYEDVLFIPLESVHSNDELTYVYKKSGIGLTRQQVSLGDQNENFVIVNEGLRENDRLYLSMPLDTAGIGWDRLDQAITAN